MIAIVHVSRGMYPRKAVLDKPASYRELPACLPGPVTVVLKAATHTEGIASEQARDRTAGGYLHDSILVQLLSFLQLLALACSGQELLGFLQLPLLNLPLQPVLLALDPAPKLLQVTIIPFTVEGLVNVSSDELERSM